MRSNPVSRGVYYVLTTCIAITFLAPLVWAVISSVSPAPGTSQTEMRLNRVSDRSAQQIAFLASGLNGQSFVGPSFFSGRLAWYRACTVTDASCNTFVGPWRYRISTRRYEQGAPGPVLVSGFADTGTRLYEVVSCPDVSVTAVPAPPPAPACAITSVAPPVFGPVAAPDLASSQPPGR